MKKKRTPTDVVLLQAAMLKGGADNWRFRYRDFRFTSTNLSVHPDTNNYSLH